MCVAAATVSMSLVACRPFERFALTSASRHVNSRRPTHSSPRISCFRGHPARAIPPEVQVAEKVHAYTRRYGDDRPSSRAKDLVDLALVPALEKPEAAALRDAIRRPSPGDPPTLDLRRCPCRHPNGHHSSDGWRPKLRHTRPTRWPPHGVKRCLIRCLRTRYATVDGIPAKREWTSFAASSVYEVSRTRSAQSQPTPSPSRSKSYTSGPTTVTLPTYSGPSPEPPRQSTSLTIGTQVPS